MKRIFLLLFVLILTSPVSAIETKNENTVITLDITVTDKDGLAYTPAKFTYRIEDVRSDTQIKDDTDITPASNEFEIDIPASLNVILDDSLQHEERAVKYQIYVGATVVYSGEYLYRIKNIEGIPFP